MKYFYLFLLTSLLISCSSSGFNEEQIRTKLNSRHTIIPENEIHSARNSKASLKFPVKLAIYLDYSAEDSRWRSDWDWFEEDEKLFAGLEKELKQLGIVSEIIIIPDAAVHGWSFGAIRKAAARYKADTLLLVNGVPFVDSYANGWSAAYITLIGLWIAPGSSKDALFALEGSLWDVNTQHIYSHFQERGIHKLRKPYIFIRDKEAIQKAKEKGLKAFVKRFSTEIKKLAGDSEKGINTPLKTEKQTAQ